MEGSQEQTPGISLDLPKTSDSKRIKLVSTYLASDCYLSLSFVTLLIAETRNDLNIGISLESPLSSVG